MIAIFRAFFGAARAELLHLYRSPLFVVLAIVQAMTLIFLVSLFGITGAMAPTAMIDDDRRPLRAAIHPQSADGAPLFRLALRHG